MSAELIISVSGLRGIVDETLTDDVARRYAAAFAAELPAGPVVIGRDGRASGARFARVIGETLASLGEGREVIDAGVAATPTVGVLVRDLRAAGGVQISASHNPPQYNGIKLFSSAGRVIPAAAGQRVLDRYRATVAAAQRPAGATTAAVSPLADPITAHLRLIEQICNVPRIHSKRFRVLLDANHGSGSVLGKVLLEHLGCETIILGPTPDGAFAHTPEPTEANLAGVLKDVVERQAAIGFCQDPDADRLAIIDELGRYIGEEKTPALCVDHVLRSGLRGPIVTNCSTSRMSEDLAAKYGVPFFRSKVGEANVVDKMLEVGALLGAEGNGGIIDPRVGLVRDSFVGMALVLDAMAARDLPVSALADELPAYAIHKSTIAVPSAAIPAALEKLATVFPNATADRLDGLRLDWPNGAWLLVRPSNTEPIVRAIAEAPTMEEARELCERSARAITP
ncbi:phosphoglucosamine mutase [Lacipirellula parvula]|uniref:Phosphoglucosamine mutase n=1 Tax=Lacipirellula parvula TaxID=2650471 RepID=A0A5K7X7M9_9BACT|nr:phosphoglucosamine mutase [Lacipirellula parvula]BBO31852.1 phosphoglucosamine mutase [Lacipirellula parvula]